MLMGNLMPLPEEQERLEKEQAQQKIEEMEVILQGIDPDQIL